MERKPAYGFSALLLLGLIYGILGLCFVLVGIGLTVFPSDAEARLTGSVFAILGGAFTLLGAVLLVLELRQRRQIRALVDAGRYLWGEVMEISPNPTIRINGRHPYVARVRVLDGRGVSHIFKSRNLRIFPDPALIGKQVRVYYRDESYKVYYVDMDSILSTVIEH